MTKTLLVSRRASFEHQDLLQTDFGLITFQPGEKVLERLIGEYDNFVRYLDVFSLSVQDVKEVPVEKVAPKVEEIAPVDEVPVVEEAPVVVEEAPVVTEEIATPVVEAPVEEVAPVVEQTPEEETTETVVQEDGTSKVTRTKRRK